MGGVNRVRLSEICYTKGILIDPQTQQGNVNYVGLENLESQTGKLVGNYYQPYQSIKSTKNVFGVGDILFGKLRPNLNKVYFAEIDGVCSTDILVLIANTEKVNAKLLSYILRSKLFNEQVLLTVSGQQLPRTSWEKISKIKISLPNVSDQQKIVTEIEQLENRIAELEAQMTESGAKKKAVLESYL